MADAATMTIKAVILPDEIQKTLKDLTFAYTPADATEKWFYSLVNVRHNSSRDLLEGAFLSKSTGTDSGGITNTIATTDKIKFLFIKNTGTTDGSTSTDESVMLVFDGSAVAHGSTNAVVIDAGESWFAKLPNTTVADLHCISADSDQTVGGGHVQCIVAAILDDI